MKTRLQVRAGVVRLTRTARPFAAAWLLLAVPRASADETAARWQRYLAAHAVALDGPERPEPLLAALRGKALVLLGETTHGTRDYYVWRAALSKALIAEAGFRFVAVEGDWGALDRLDAYVRHREPLAASARAVLETFDRWPEWMWANAVIEDLAEWLHAWNAERPPERRAGIHGLDVYGWGESVDRLPEVLEVLDSGWGARAAEGLAPLKRLGGDSQAFYQAVATARPTGAEAVDEILETLRREAGDWRRLYPDAWLQAKQQVSLLRQAKRHLHKNARRHPRSWNPRAENFMQTVLRLRDYYGPGACGIVWAHNTHIGDARHTPMGGAGLVTVGQRARERLGETNVYLLGFASDRGSFRAGLRWGGPGIAMALPTAAAGTFDAFLRDGAPARAFLPLADARADPLLLRPVGHRAVGVVHEDGADMRHNAVPSVIPLRYDGIVYLRETTALNGLER